MADPLWAPTRSRHLVLSDWIRPRRRGGFSYLKSCTYLKITGSSCRLGYGGAPRLTWPHGTGTCGKFLRTSNSNGCSPEVTANIANNLWPDETTAPWPLCRPRRPPAAGWVRRRSRRVDLSQGRGDRPSRRRASRSAPIDALLVDGWGHTSVRTRQRHLHATDSARAAAIALTRSPLVMIWP